MLLAISSEKTFCTVPFEPEACTVKKELNWEFGVPESTPAELRNRPLGTPPCEIDHVQPLPHPGAVNAWVKNVPTKGSAPPPCLVIANGSTVRLSPTRNGFDVEAAPHSPFNAGFVASHSGMRFPLKSVHERATHEKLGE